MDDLMHRLACIDELLIIWNSDLWRSLQHRSFPPSR